MSHYCAARRVPRAGVDVITGARPALAVIQLAMTLPPRHETVVLVLDGEHRGVTVVVVGATAEPDAVIGVVETLAESVASVGPPGALVVATVRPGGSLDVADGDRWMECTEIAEQVGVQLLEWFVVGSEGRRLVAWCPRDMLAEPPRWTP